MAMKREADELDPDEPPKWGMSPLSFFSELMSKQVFNTMNTFFYRSYEAAGVEFESLKCFNIKRYAANESKIDAILAEAKHFLTELEQRALRILMTHKDDEEQKIVVRMFCFQDRATGKFFRRFVRVFRYRDNSKIVRFTSVNIDRQLYPILTFVQFRFEGEFDVTPEMKKQKPELACLEQSWTVMNDKARDLACSALKAKYSQNQELSVAEIAKEFIDDEGRWSSMTTDPEGRDALTLVTDILGLTTQDLQNIRDMKTEQDLVHENAFLCSRDEAVRKLAASNTAKRTRYFRRNKDDEDDEDDEGDEEDDDDEDVEYESEVENEGSLQDHEGDEEDDDDEDVEYESDVENGNEEGSLQDLEEEPDDDDADEFEEFE